MQFDQVMFGVHEHPETKFEKYYFLFTQTWLVSRKSPTIKYWQEKLRITWIY